MTLTEKLVICIAALVWGGFIAIKWIVRPIANRLQRRANSERIQRHRSCWIYCPRCKRDLNADDQSFMYVLETGAQYHCATCKEWSRWDFDGPVPILKEHEPAPGMYMIRTDCFIRRDNKQRAWDWLRNWAGI